MPKNHLQPNPLDILEAGNEKICLIRPLIKVSFGNIQVRGHGLADGTIFKNDREKDLMNPGNQACVQSETT